ncbi:MAG: 4,5-DOPA dioxygenase extradiol [Planctomycetes bacterium]|nr:4,5-DOPA dioxygenase extradiol [Planctomycetota bacterium]
MEQRNPRMPVLFVGHGSPMNAIEDNRWSRAFVKLGNDLPPARAVLCVSAHWYGAGTLVTTDEEPRTIHDFGGFPHQLYEVRYAAPGSLELARRVAALTGARDTAERGLDHGCWSVLVHTHPRADVPVVQLGIDAGLAPEEHVALGRALAPLRDEGVLIVGSGNVTHDLRDAFARVRTGDASTPDWALRFDRAVADALARRDVAAIVGLWPGTADGRRAHPTPDHWLPLLYAVGASDAQDTVTFPIEGFDLGSLSMRAVRFG